jgi:alpha/beta hydrolase fold
MLTSRFGVIQRNSNWTQHVRLFQPRRALPPDEPYFCLGAVFTVQARDDDGAWNTIFRRALLKRDTGWQHWDIPLDAVVNKAGQVNVRLITDAYSRAVDRKAPTWKWGYWGQPRVVQVTAGGQRELRHDLIEHIDRAKALVQLDDTGKLRGFDGKGEDSTGATFRPTASGTGMPEPAQPAIAAFTPHHDGNSGVTVAEYERLVIANERSDERKPAPPPLLPDGVRLIPDLEYAHPDGHSLLLDLYVPPRGDQPAPIILWVHGSGWDMGDRHDRTAVPLTAYGYAVASIDYRLSQQATFPAQIEDCKAAVRWLRAHAKGYNLDGDHIGAWGASAGGHLVALLGTSGDVKELEGDEGNLEVTACRRSATGSVPPT